MSYLPNHEAALVRAVEQIKKDYGDDVSIEAYNKPLRKFGRNESVGSGPRETVFLTGQDETYATGNDITGVESTNGGDDQAIVVQGHTLSGSDFTFVSQSVTLDGTNFVNFTTPLARVERGFNDDDTDFDGDVRVRVSASGNVHLTMAEDNQSLKCAFTTASNEYALIKAISCGVDKQQNRSVDFSLQVRLFGKVFRTQMQIETSSSSGHKTVSIDPVIIVPPNSDVRMLADSSGGSTGVSSTLFGHYAGIQ